MSSVVLAGSSLQNHDLLSRSQRFIQVPPVLVSDTTSGFTEIVVPDEGRNHSSEGYVCLAVGTVAFVRSACWSFIICSSKCPDVLAWCAAIRKAHSIYIESIYRQPLVKTEWVEVKGD